MLPVADLVAMGFTEGHGHMPSKADPNICRACGQAREAIHNHCAAGGAYCVAGPEHIDNGVCTLCGSRSNLVTCRYRANPHIQHGGCDDAVPIE